MTNCPCGSSSTYDDCCGPYIAGTAAPTAEALMRSRYTAYTEGNNAYLIETLAPESRDEEEEAQQNHKSNMKWQGLEIRTTSEGGEKDETGIVEFVARYKVGDQSGIHHERSNFRREEGRWVCIGGEINPKPEQRIVDKVGRNDPCPCGSGKKFKKCCGA
ncbi:MAG: YchJ family protein [Rhodospirillales bacterium]|nr:YchJ family protein [Rhodospirillales bacterium]